LSSPALFVGSAGFVLPGAAWCLATLIRLTADQAGKNEWWRKAGRSAAENSICRMARPANPVAR
jgi:hypothetical protein